jgi:hypothetical protein
MIKMMLIFLVLSVILVAIIIIWRDTAQYPSTREGFDDASSIERIKKQELQQYMPTPVWSNKLDSLILGSSLSPISIWSPNVRNPSGSAALIGYNKLGDNLATSLALTVKPVTVAPSIVVKGDVQPPLKYTKLLEIKNADVTAENVEVYTNLINNIASAQSVPVIIAELREVLGILGSMSTEIKAALATKIPAQLRVYRYTSVRNGEFGDYHVKDFNIKFTEPGIASVITKPDSGKGIVPWSLSTTWSPTSYNMILSSDSLAAAEFAAAMPIPGTTVQPFIKTLKTKTLMQAIPSGGAYGSDYMVALPPGISIKYKSGDRTPTTITTDVTISAASRPPTMAATVINESTKNVASSITTKIVDANKLSFVTNSVVQPVKVSLSDLINYEVINTKLTNIAARLRTHVSAALLTIFSNVMQYMQAYVQSMMLTYNNVLSVVRCKHKDVPQYYWDIASQAAEVEISTTAGVDTAIVANVGTMNIGWDMSQQNSEVVNFLKKVQSYIGVLTNLSGNKLRGPMPLTIFRPEAPRDYVALGDIAVVLADDIALYDEYPELGCVPVGCVKDMRPWRSTDILYENIGGAYFALFYNPYVGTFKTVTVRGELPAGNMQKVVACIKKCSQVDKLVQSDKCAQQMRIENNKMESEEPIIDSIAMDEEQAYYMDKIVRRDADINTLKDGVKLIRNKSEQIDMMNRANSRQKLQSYLDGQMANIDAVRQKLPPPPPNGTNDIVGNLEVNVRVPKNVDVLARIIAILEDSNIPNKRLLIDKLVASQHGKNNIVTKEEVENKVDDIMSHCPEINPNLIKKSVVKNLCMGCH